MKKPISPEDLLLLPIRWRSVGLAWAASVDGQDCSLKMNDFPDEPLYTVRVGGESLDLDDRPKAWVIEPGVNDPS